MMTAKTMKFVVKEIVWMLAKSLFVEPMLNVQAGIMLALVSVCQTMKATQYLHAIPVSIAWLK